MPKKTVIRLVQLASRERAPESGQYLKAYDPDQNAGRGHIEGTDDKMQALRFDDVIEAATCWRRQSRTHPFRLSDGEPNRPLTAFTITFETVDV